MTKNSFEDWHIAAAEYAHKHLDLWDFQIKEMASDFAWRMEGADITDESLHEAYEDWISGNNPYCFAHGITLDGYDQQGQWEHDSRVAMRNMVDLVVSEGWDIRIAERMAHDVYAAKGNEIGIYKSGRYYRKWIESWEAGEFPQSPHSVKLDPKNITEREERLKQIKNRGHNDDVEAFGFRLDASVFEQNTRMMSP